MRVAVISDVHSNLAALEAVLSALSADAIDQIWHLGDIVGYGAQPNEVVAKLVECDARGVLGNHDAAAAEIIDFESFNPTAAEAARWTAAKLDEASATYIRGLPERAEAEGTVRVHGSLRNPMWEYVATEEAALAQFELQHVPISLVGHTHIPLVARLQPPDSIAVLSPEPGQTVELSGERLIVNPGSVGQPRDGDARASFLILDTRALLATFRRVEYDVAATQKGILAAGLPQSLAARLAHGR